MNNRENDEIKKTQSELRSVTKEILDIQEEIKKPYVKDPNEKYPVEGYILNRLDLNKKIEIKKEEALRLKSKLAGLNKNNDVAARLDLNEKIEIKKEEALRLKSKLAKLNKNNDVEGEKKPTEEIPKKKIKERSNLIKIMQFIGNLKSYFLSKLFPIFSDFVSKETSLALDFFKNVVSYSFITFFSVIDLYRALKEKVLGQRKTIIGVAVFNIALSIISLGLVLAAANPVGVAILLVAAMISYFYQQSYIYYQARQETKKLQNEFNIMKNDNPEKIKLEDSIKKQKNKQFREGCTVVTNIFTVASSALFLAGVFFPPLLSIGLVLWVARSLIEHSLLLHNSRMSIEEKEEAIKSRENKLEKETDPKERELLITEIANHEKARQSLKAQRLESGMNVSVRILSIIGASLFAAGILFPPLIVIGLSILVAAATIKILIRVKFFEKIRRWVNPPLSLEGIKEDIKKSQETQKIKNTIKIESHPTSHGSDRMSFVSQVSIFHATENKKNGIDSRGVDNKTSKTSSNPKKSY